jgi:hypothetical protein
MLPPAAEPLSVRVGVLQAEYAVNPYYGSLLTAGVARQSDVTARVHIAGAHALFRAEPRTDGGIRFF